VVYEAMVAHTDVPENDHFQIIGEHAADNFIFDPDYLGVRRSNDLIMIQIVFNEGRTVAQKQAFTRRSPMVSQPLSISGLKTSSSAWSR
jgi:4-oxalocrotonate tautomerase